MFHWDRGVAWRFEPDAEWRHDVRCSGLQKLGGEVVGEPRKVRIGVEIEKRTVRQKALIYRAGLL